MIQVDSSELVELFENLYAEESSAKEVLQSVRNDLKEYAGKIETKPAVLNSAYSLFKRLKEHPDQAPAGDEVELTNIIENYFN